jgi:hypothetical protein
MKMIVGSRSTEPFPYLSPGFGEVLPVALRMQQNDMNVRDELQISSQRVTIH